MSKTTKAPWQPRWVAVSGRGDGMSKSKAVKNGASPAIAIREADKGEVQNIPVKMDKLGDFLAQAVGGTVDGYLARLAELAHVKEQNERQKTVLGEKRLKEKERELAALKGEVQQSDRKTRSLEAQLSELRAIRDKLEVKVTNLQLASDQKDKELKAKEALASKLKVQLEQGAKEKSVTAINKAIAPTVVSKPVLTPLQEQAVKQFAGWEKVDVAGRILPAHALQYAAVIDQKAKLMWAINHHTSAGFPNPVKAMTWQEAQDWLKQVNQRGWCGHKDWRLPTLEELVEPIAEEEVQQDVNIPWGAGTLYSSRSHGRLSFNNKILPLEEAVDYELHENEHLLKERRSGMRDLIPLAEVDRYYRDMAQVKAVDEILANLEKNKGALELSNDVSVTDAVLVDECMPEGSTLWAELMAWCTDRAVPVSPSTNVILVTTYRHYGWSVPKSWDFMKTKSRSLDALHRELLKFSEEIEVFAWDDLCKELTTMANTLLVGFHLQKLKCQDFMDDYAELKTLLADDVLKAFSKHMMTLIYDTLFIGKPSALHERLGIAPTVFTILPLEHVFMLPATAADLGLSAAGRAAVVDPAVTPALAASLQVYFNTRHTKHISRVRITTLDNQSLYVFNYPDGVCCLLSEHALRGPEKKYRGLLARQDILSDITDEPYWVWASLTGSYMGDKCAQEHVHVVRSSQ